MKLRFLILVISSTAFAGPPEFSHFDVESFVSVPTGLWVVGRDNCDEGGAVHAEYWLGSAPRPAAGPPASTPARDTARSGDTIYTVGDAGSIRVSRDAGKTFVSESSGTKRALHAVWLRSPTEVYAAGDHGTLLVKRGTAAWTRIKIRSDADLFGVWGAGADLYAFGASSVVSHDGGKTWTVLPEYINAIGGTSDTEVYSAGWGGIRVTRDHAKTWDPVFIEARRCYGG